jgi:hypothetical protein
MALNFNINEFRSKLNGGAKPNLFEISLSLPTTISLEGENPFGSEGNFKFLCRSGAIPSFTLGLIEVPFRGRRIKLPGDRTFADWTVTVLNDEEQNMRYAFDQWMALINNPDGEEAIREENSEYRCTINVKHLNGDGEVTRWYKLYDAFPTDVGAIDLSQDNTDVIQDFTVTFQYHYHEAGADGGEPGTSSPSE